MPVIGTQQSPIKIVHDKTLHTTFPPHYFDIGYKAGKLPGHFEEHNFWFTSPSAPVTFRKEKWVLERIHIHRPPEHKIDAGPVADFEVHLVHVRQNDPCERGEALVIGVFFKSDPGADENESFKEIDRAIERKLKEDQGVDAPKPAKALWLPESMTSSMRIKPRDFLPKREEDWKRWYHYEGSLTTEPFSESVSWFVLPVVAEVRSSDVRYLATQTFHEPRKVHALDRRFVLRSFAE